MVRPWRGCRCPGAWHVWREAAGTCETLTVPGGGVRYADISHERGNPDTEVAETYATSYTGKTIQPKEEYLKTVRESDTLIVLGDGRADHMGKGCTRLCSPHRKHVPDM